MIDRPEDTPEEAAASPLLQQFKERIAELEAED